jgi:ubiquinol-cytochrome c reductase cytochrome c1 subunit
MKKTLSILLLAALLGLAPLNAVHAQDSNPLSPTQRDVTPAEPSPPADAASPDVPGEPAAETAAPAAAPAGDKAACAETHAPPHGHWPHQGAFGTYDKAALQRGFQVYKEVCSSCHAMKFLSYRDLTALGYSPEQVKALAAQATVADGPNDEGEMFERPARPSDRFKSPFPNDKAARFANNGALPPDLSLIVKARHHGEDYIHALLTGYATPSGCAEMMPGMNWNTYFPSHQIAMPPPLAEGGVSFADGTGATVEQQARDVVQFLAWASEPHMESRKAMGFKVLFFMLVFAGVMRAAKRRIWADVR